MEKYISLTLDFILSPKNTIEKLKQNNLPGFALFIFILAVFTQALANQVVLSADSSHSVPLLYINFLFWLAVLLSIFVLYLAWIHFVSSMFHKEGNIKTAITAGALCFIPLFLAFPFSSIFAAFSPSPVEWYSGLMSIIGLWILILFFISIKNTYSLSGSQTITILISPIVFIPVFLVISILGIMILVMSFS
ncbi:MAG: hypothetical protein KKH91_04965 [Elusimicrobia bacterium]|nr:hypothetical protein [Elusimicrobiota bacterium]MBU2614325.1 hypothetical protein [Elusimicrobiota bacterium]